MTNYERKRETPECKGAWRVKCIRDWVFDCPECDKRVAVQYDGNGDAIKRLLCPNCFADLVLEGELDI